MKHPILDSVATHARSVAAAITQLWKSRLRQALVIVAQVVIVVAGTAYMYATSTADGRALVIGLGVFVGVMLSGLALVVSVQSAIANATNKLIPATPGSVIAKPADYLPVLHARIDRVNSAIDATRQTSLALVGAVAVLLTIIGTNKDIVDRLREAPVAICGLVGLAILAATLSFVVAAIPWLRFTGTPPNGCSLGALVDPVRAEELRAIALHRFASTLLVLGIMFLAMAVIGSILALVRAF